MSRGTALRRALAGLLLVAGCDDGAAPDRAPSDFYVHVYIEADDTLGMAPADPPLRAVVTVVSNDDDDLVRVDSTGADGQVAFPELPAGAYTVSHVPTDLPAGVELIGSWRQTVVAPFAGDSVVTRFAYRYTTGALAGVVFRDDDISGSYEEGVDSTWAGVPLLLFAGSDTTAAPVAADTTDAAGEYLMAALEPGAYVLLVRTPAGTATAAANPRAVSIEAGAPAFLPIELVSDSIEAAGARR